MHAMIRRYRVRLGTVEQAARHADRGFLPLLRQIPGFVSCQLVDAGNDILTCMALFETPDGTADAVRASREWFRDEWSSFRPCHPRSWWERSWRTPRATGAGCRTGGGWWDRSARRPGRARSAGPARSGAPKP